MHAWLTVYLDLTFPPVHTFWQERNYPNSPLLSHRGSRVKLTKKFAPFLIYLVYSLFFLPLDVLVRLCLLRILKGGGLSSRDGMLWKLTEEKKEVRWRDVDQLTLCVSKVLDSCVRHKTNAFQIMIPLKCIFFLQFLW